MTRRPIKAGAGGFWNVIDERPDDSVERQLTPYSCVAAVGAMLLATHGITVTQSEIIDIIGEASSVEQLAVFLNTAHVNEAKIWRGGYIQSEDFTKAALTGQFAVVFREESPLGHMVLVNEVTDDLVFISDPWQGTRYAMSMSEFIRVWDRGTVFYGTY